MSKQARFGAKSLIILIFLFVLSMTHIVFRFVERTINENTIPMKDVLDNIEIHNWKKYINDVEKAKTKRQLQVKELQKQNEDITAWLEIEGTNISYPVLYCKDNNYYVTHDYKKGKSKDGALFLDARYDFRAPSTNLIIYGHNNQNGKMFSTLIKYKNESYYKSHPIIKYTTFEEEAEYEVIAAFYSRVYYQNEKNVFKYYCFLHANNETEYNEYVNNSKEASLYDTGKTAKYGERLLTLSTCSYHTKNGRFVVVAKKK